MTPSRQSEIGKKIRKQNNEKKNKEIETLKMLVKSQKLKLEENKKTETKLNRQVMFGSNQSGISYLMNQKRISEKLIMQQILTGKCQKVQHIG